MKKILEKLSVKYKGFTLAEVLITLAIIGVIATITIPSFVKSYRKKVYASKIMKVYSQLQDSVTSELGEEHTKDFNLTKAGQVTSCTDGDKGICEAGPGYFLNKYFKIAKRGTDCKKGTCFAASYKTTSGADAKTFANEPGTDATRYCIQTVDGAAICAIRNNTELNTYFFIDTNGVDEPNVTGYDAFVFIITPGSNKVRDVHSDGSKCNTKDGSHNHIMDYTRGCFAKILQDGGKITY